MQAHFLRYSCEIFTTKTCYVENKNIRLSIEKMRKMRIAMLRMRMCCCRISGGGTSNRLFTTGGFIIVPPSYTFISHSFIFFLFIHIQLYFHYIFSHPFHIYHLYFRFNISLTSSAPILYIYTLLIYFPPISTFSSFTSSSIFLLSSASSISHFSNFSL